MIVSGVESSHTHAPLIQAIKALVAQAWIVSIQHTLREGNFYVDWLANKGSFEFIPLSVLETCP
ncbi:hypothetical protein JHK87_026309 [Glycine soja]|nr:hypothetical protein JHK87_026309 [Glycine soja]